MSIEENCNSKKQITVEKVTTEEHGKLIDVDTKRLTFKGNDYRVTKGTHKIVAFRNVSAHVFDIANHGTKLTMKHDLSFLKELVGDIIGKEINVEEDILTIGEEEYDPKRLCFTEIVFENDDAKKIVTELNFTKLDGIPMYIYCLDKVSQKAFRNKNCYLYVSGVEENIEVSQLSEAFSNFGNIINICPAVPVKAAYYQPDKEGKYKPRKSFTWCIVYEKAGDARRAMVDLQEATINGRSVTITSKGNHNNASANDDRLSVYVTPVVEKLELVDSSYTFEFVYSADGISKFYVNREIGYDKYGNVLDNQFYFVLFDKQVPKNYGYKLTYIPDNWRNCGIGINFWGIMTTPETSFREVYDTAISLGKVLWVREHDKRINRVHGECKSFDICWDKPIEMETVFNMGLQIRMVTAFDDRIEWNLLKKADKLGQFNTFRVSKRPDNEVNKVVAVNSSNPNSMGYVKQASRFELNMTGTISISKEDSHELVLTGDKLKLYQELLEMNYPSGPAKKMCAKLQPSVVLKMLSDPEYRDTRTRFHFEML